MEQKLSACKKESAQSLRESLAAARREADAEITDARREAAEAARAVAACQQSEQKARREAAEAVAAYQQSEQAHQQTVQTHQQAVREHQQALEQSEAAQQQSMSLQAHEHREQQLTDQRAMQSLQAQASQRIAEAGGAMERAVAACKAEGEEALENARQCGVAAEQAVVIAHTLNPRP
jgi:hypothetical protein